MKPKRNQLNNEIEKWIANNPPCPHESATSRRTRAYRAMPHGDIEDAINEKAAARRIFDILFDRVAARRFNQRITPISTKEGINHEFIDVEKAELTEIWQAFDIRRRNILNSRKKMRKESLRAAKVYKNNHSECHLSTEQLADLFEDGMEDVA